MKLSLFISSGLALTLVGCSAFKKSATWQKVVENRADRVAVRDGDTSRYPEHLHATLAAQNVEHKIVTYQYNYKNRQREEAVGVGRAVFYRDTTTPGSQWWAMDESRGFPVWVPDEGVERQVAFFARRNAQVVTQQVFPAGEGNKTFDTVPAMASPLAPAAAPARVARTTPRQTVPVSTADSVPPPPQPAAEDSAARAEWLDSVERRFDDAFRSKHGTPFDRHSSTDRQKMALLRDELTPESAQF